MYFTDVEQGHVRKTRTRPSTPAASPSGLLTVPSPMYGPRRTPTRSTPKPRSSRSKSSESDSSKRPRSGTMEKACKSFFYFFIPCSDLPRCSH